MLLSLKALMIVRHHIELRRTARARLCLVSLAIVIVILTAVSMARSGQDESPSDRDNVLPKNLVALLISNAKALGKVGIEFTVQREYRDPGLPRAKRDEIYTYIEEGKLFQRQARTLPMPGRGDDEVIVTESSYDGEVFYIGNRKKEGGGSLVKMLGENPEDPQTRNAYTSFPYFDAVGFSLPSTVLEWRSLALHSTIAQLVSEGKVSSVLTEGTTLMITLTIPEPYVSAAKSLDLDEIAKQLQRSKIEPSQIQQQIDAYKRVRSLDWLREVKLWLDVDKGFALKRRSDFAPHNRLIQTIDCNEFKYTGRASVWLPWNCIVKTYVKSPQLLNEFTDDPNETSRIELRDLSFEPRKDVVFALNYGPGTFVTDHSTKAAKSSPFGAKSYVIPGEKDDLRKAAEGKLKQGRHFFIVANVVVLLFLITLIIARQWTKHRHA